MAGLLERLGPLVEFLEAAPDFDEATSLLLGAIQNAEAPDDPNLVMALRYAGIMTGSGNFSSEARDDIIRADTIARSRRDDAEVGWEPVVTVPPYLREAVPQGSVRETFHVIRRLIAEASSSVVVASPFLDSGFSRFIPGLAQLVQRGGTVELITRRLSKPDSPNARVVKELRSRCESATDAIKLVSWDEERLGLHLKAVLADNRKAYVGSANFTWGGLTDHMELGVVLQGQAVETIVTVIEELSGELSRRSRLQSR